MPTEKYICLTTSSSDEWFDGDTNTCIFPLSLVSELVNMQDKAIQAFALDDRLSAIEFDAWPRWIEDLPDEMWDEGTVVLELDLDELSEKSTECDTVRFYRHDKECLFWCYVKHTDTKISTHSFDPRSLAMEEFNG